ncbi:MAG: DUF371 domain-containing protein [Candidatus Aenigmarchaeota archaeon]|nr:DUF371 domain-containing protein [Candidatus Aenigmarchaeota archaeon]
MIKESFFVYGHENVLSLHPTTLEFTKDSELTLKGDCILGVCATKSLCDFSDEFKKKIRDDKVKVSVEIEADGVKDVVSGFGHPDLTLSDAEDMVIRKSGFVCGRTLCVHADKAAADVDNKIIEHLKKAGSKAKVTISISD